MTLGKTRTASAAGLSDHQSAPRTSVRTASSATPGTATSASATQAAALDTYSHLELDAATAAAAAAANPHLTPEEIQNLLLESTLKRQRLARKAALARACRQRKKSRLEQLEDEVALLRAELAAERAASQAAAAAAASRTASLEADLAARDAGRDAANKSVESPEFDLLLGAVAQFATFFDQVMPILQVIQPTLNRLNANRALSSRIAAIRELQKHQHQHQPDQPHFASDYASGATSPASTSTHVSSKAHQAAQMMPHLQQRDPAMPALHEVAQAAQAAQAAQLSTASVVSGETSRSSSVCPSQESVTNSQVSSPTGSYYSPSSPPSECESIPTVIGISAADMPRQQQPSQLQSHQPSYQPQMQSAAFLLTSNAVSPPVQSHVTSSGLPSTTLGFETNQPVYGTASLQDEFAVAHRMNYTNPLFFASIPALHAESSGRKDVATIFDTLLMRSPADD